MLTILNHLRNEDLLVVMDKKSSLGSIKFKQYLYYIKYFSNESELLKIISKFKPNIIFNDILISSAEPNLGFWGKFLFCMFNSNDLIFHPKFLEQIFLEKSENLLKKYDFAENSKSAITFYNSQKQKS